MPITNRLDDLVFGSPEHAFAITEGRHAGVRDGLQWLTFAHLPPALKVYSSIFYSAAANLIAACQTDSPELTTSLNRIIEAKDSGVRAGIRNDTGRAGSVPRPQAVVDTPTLSDPRAQTTLVGEDQICSKCSRPQGKPHASWCPAQDVPSEE